MKKDQVETILTLVYDILSASESACDVLSEIEAVRAHINLEIGVDRPGIALEVNAILSFGLQALRHAAADRNCKLDDYPLYRSATVEKFNQMARRIVQTYELLAHSSTSENQKHNQGEVT